ncbi:MAG: hypothetical protein HY814_14810 [Candidatus Riflebacteria bacterium]|nr:hypothetical protein [Candidatus Riflebacteria bacterium]
MSRGSRRPAGPGWRFLLPVLGGVAVVLAGCSGEQASSDVLPVVQAATSAVLAVYSPKLQAGDRLVYDSSTTRGAEVTRYLDTFDVLSVDAGGKASLRKTQRRTFPTTGTDLTLNLQVGGNLQTYVMIVSTDCLDSDLTLDARLTFGELQQRLLQFVDCASGLTTGTQNLSLGAVNLVAVDTPAQRFHEALQLRTTLAPPPASEVVIMAQGIGVVDYTRTLADGSLTSRSQLRSASVGNVRAGLP